MTIIINIIVFGTILSYGIVNLLQIMVILKEYFKIDKRRT